MSTTTTAALSDLLHSSRYTTRLSQHTAEASIEVTNIATNNTSIELPEEIKSLITGSDFWVKAKTNRYLLLIRQGYGELLTKLAREAQTKRHPANWFAKVCSKANWQQTLDYAKKLADMTRQAAETTQRLGQKLGSDLTTFIYQQLWRGVNTVRHAALAAETPHQKPGQSVLQHFVWLCANAQRPTPKQQANHL